MPWPDVGDIPEPLRDAAEWAAGRSLLVPRPDGTFDPDGPALTRGQAAVALWRSAGSPAPDPGEFGDEVPADVLDAALWCVQQGLMVAPGGMFEAAGVHLSRLDAVVGWDRSRPPPTGLAATTMQSAVQWDSITITFADPAPVGVHASGEPFVLGPVTIQSVTPNGTNDGADLDPEVNDQGLRSGAPGYSAARRATYPLPIGVEPGGPRIFVACSGTTVDGQPSIGQACVLTVYHPDDHPFADQLRPPVHGGDKAVVRRLGNLDRESWPQLGPATVTMAYGNSSEPSIAAVLGQVNRPWVQAADGTNTVNAYRAMSYGSGYSQNSLAFWCNDAIVKIMRDPTGAETTPLVAALLQRCIDFYGQADAGIRWRPNGGWVHWRRFGMLWAGHVLGDQDIIDTALGLGQWEAGGELGMTYWWEGTDTAVPQAYRDAGAAWKNSEVPTNGDWPDPYRMCCTAICWGAQALAMRAFGMEQLWGHEPFFVYMQTWWDVENQNVGTWGGPTWAGGAIVATHRASFPAIEPPPEPAGLQVIVDTDMKNDADDVVAMSMLFAAARLGQLDVVGAVYHAREPANGSLNRPAAGVISALAAWHGLEFPVASRKDGFGPDNGVGTFTPTLRAEFANLAYVSMDVLDSSVPEATRWYRDTLAAADDGSITLLTIGYFTSVRGLLNSPANLDGDGLPSGADLMAAKVDRVVSMATSGGSTTNPEYNVHRNANAAADFIANCPVPIEFVGWNVGAELRTGRNYNQYPSGHIVRRALEAFGSSYATGHTSWDPITVLYLLEGEDVLLGQRGTMSTNPSTGVDTWTASAQGPHWRALAGQSAWRPSGVTNTQLETAMDALAFLNQVGS